MTSLPLASGALLLGLLLLYLGAEGLVKGAVGLARAFGSSQVVVGLTVVAYATSTPELVVVTTAALQEKSELALGNIIGANVANVGLVLGVSALVAPLPAHGDVIRRELVALVLTTLALPLLFIDGGIGRVEAAALLLGAATFTLQIARGARDPERARLVEAEAGVAATPRVPGLLRPAALVAIGLLLLVGGGSLLVEGATSAARLLGVSERVMGLTALAVGTTAPELTASVVAAARGHGGLVVGNVIGSNVLNVLFVLGGAGLVHPIVGDLAAVRMDLLALGLMTAVAVVVLRTKRDVSRVEGGLLAAAYAAFLLTLAL